jgi:hypothetical protein
VRADHGVDLAGGHQVTHLPSRYRRIGTAVHGGEADLPTQDAARVVDLFGGQLRAQFTRRPDQAERSLQRDDERNVEPWVGVLESMRPPLAGMG